MKKNIVFVFSDQQRPDSMGCYGQKLNTTPNIDKWSKSATVFDNAFSCQPICGPARSCLQSGKFATRTGCFNNDVAYPLDEKTIADYLNENGYNTAYIGKWHLANTAKRLAHEKGRPGQQEEFLCKNELVPQERRGGWQYWRAVNIMENVSHAYDGFLGDNEMNILPFKPESFRVDAITDYAVNYLESYDGDKPFCMMLSFLEPHWQNDMHTHSFPVGADKAFENYEIPPSLKPFDGKAGWLTDGFFKEYPKYLAGVNSIDNAFGRIIEALKSNGLYENTIIIYSSDHGCHFGYRNPGAKDSCHDDSIHIPLLIGGAGVPARRFDNLVSLIDIPATILDAAQIHVPEDYDGISLLKQIDGRESRNVVFYQISPAICARGIRTKSWAYSVTAPYANGDLDSGADVYQEAFLYDLKNDASEHNNLIADADYESIRNELRSILCEQMKAAGEAVPIILDSSSRRIQ